MPITIKNTYYLLFGFVLSLLTLTVRCDDDSPKKVEKKIIRFIFKATKNNGLSEDVTASVSDTNIVARVPSDTDITGLIPTITIPATLTLSPKNNEAQDFTKPVTYTVWAKDSTKKLYSAKVVVDPSRRANITALTVKTVDDQSIHGVVGKNTINLVDTFTNDMPEEVIITAITVSPHAQADVTVGDRLTFKKGFSEVVVTAEDGVAVKSYTIIPINAGTQIVSFQFKKAVNDQAYISLNDQDTLLQGNIDYLTKNIEVLITPYVYELNRTALVPTFEVAPGSVVRVAGRAQQSGVTPNDFREVVIYEVVDSKGKKSEQYTVVLTTTNRAVIPDSKFQAYLNNNIPNAFDEDGKMDVTHEEVEAYTRMDVSRKGIASLQGIEFFTSLKALYCYSNQLPSLNLRKNESLETLSCYSNKLQQLHIDKNNMLTRLWCYNNQLEALDLSQNSALTILSCYSNKLTRLKLTGNENMEVLSCRNNQLTHLDIARINHINLLIIDAGELQDKVLKNPLTKLDVSIALKDYAEIKEAKRKLTHKLVIAVYDKEGYLNCPDYDPNIASCN